MTSFKMTGLGGENTLKILKETQCLSMDGAMVSFFLFRLLLKTTLKWLQLGVENQFCYFESHKFQN